MQNNGILANGLRLVIRRPALLGWLFLFNLLLGLLASVAPRLMFANVLNSSLHSQEFLNTFSLGALSEFISRPDVAVGPLLAQSYAFALLYLAFMLFVSGGITATYLENRTQTRAEFFEYSGRYLFRMLRLALLALVPFGLLSVLVGIITATSSALGEGTSAPPLSFYVLIGGFVLTFVLGLFVRAWLDLAQARIVDRDERSVVMAALRSFPLAGRHAHVLTWAYLRIAIATWLFWAGAIWIWIRLPHAAVNRSFAVLELALVVSILARLMQRATAITCYQQYMPIPVINVPMQSMQSDESIFPENPLPEQVSEDRDVSANQASTATNHRTL